MPYVEKRGDGPYPYRVRWPLPGQKTEAGNQAYDSASGFADYDSARDYGLDMESDLRRGRYRNPRSGETLLKDWVQTWRAKQRVSKRTLRNRDNSLEIHLLPAFGYKALADINWWMVSNWGLEQTCARSSTTKRIALLSQILTAAVDAKLIDENPILGRRLGGTPTRRNETVWARAGDAVAIAERFPRLPDRYRMSNGKLRSNAFVDERLAGMLRLLVYTLDGTGLRIGEALALHRDNCGLWRRDLIDGVPWRRRVIRVDPTVGQWLEFFDREMGEKTNHFGPPKPPHGAREIDIPDYLWAMIEEHLATWPHPYLFCRPDTIPGPDGNPQVQMYSRGAFDHILASVTDGQAARRQHAGWAALDAWQPIRPGLSAHGLRHGHNTAMIELGTPDIMRCDRMGHSTTGIQGIYSHPTPAMRRRLLAALQERHETALGVHAAPSRIDDHFPEFSHSITDAPRRKLRAV